MSSKTKRLSGTMGNQQLAANSSSTVPFTDATRHGRLRRSLIALVLLAGLTAAAYHNADHEEFEFDSAGTVIANSKTLDTWRIVRDLFRALLGGGAGLAMLSFSLNCAANRAVGLDQFDVTSFLVVNVVIHAINAFLVYVLLVRLLGLTGSSRRGSFAIPLVLAALFAVHPIHASSIAYIVQRRGALATLFYLLGNLSYLAARRGSGAARWPWAVLVAVCYWSSYQSKSLGLTLPLALAAMEVCLCTVDRTARRRLPRGWAVGVLAGVVVLIAFLATHGLLDAIKYPFRPSEGGVMWSPWVHFLTESRVFLHYWKLLLLPLPQWSAIDHPFDVSNNLLEHAAVLAVLVHAAILFLAVRAALRGWALGALGVAWFYIALIPYALVPQPELYVEYKTYLPGVGVVMILAEGLRRLIERWSLRACIAPVWLAVLLLLIVTVRRNVIYRDPIAMWSDSVAKAPGYVRPRLNLSMALLDQNRFDEARLQSEEALRLCDQYSRRLRLGGPWFQEAPQLAFVQAGAHIMMGIILKEQRCPREAEQHLREGVRLAPQVPEGWLNLAMLQYLQGRLNEAIASFDRALQINPEYPDAYFYLGQALQRTGQRARARAAYQEALRLQPTHDAAREQLKALRLTPDS